MGAAQEQARQSQGQLALRGTPKAGKGARCLIYVLARGNVVSRKGFGLRSKTPKFWSQLCH